MSHITGISKMEYTYTHAFSQQKLRPVFIIDDIPQNYVSKYAQYGDIISTQRMVCTAGGIMIGCIYNGVVFWLFQRKIRKTIGNYHIYEDFGGGIDISDKHIINTIYREASEETNNILSADILNEIYKIGVYTSYTYINACKYLSSIVIFDYNDASDELRKLFDLREQTKPIYVENQATLHWLCQIPLKLLNPRIRNLSRTQNWY
jgi:hypothetical protein